VSEVDEGRSVVVDADSVSSVLFGFKMSGQYGFRFRYHFGISGFVAFYHGRSDGFEGEEFGGYLGDFVKVDIGLVVSPVVEYYVALGEVVVGGSGLHGG